MSFKSAVGPVDEYIGGAALGETVTESLCGGWAVGDNRDPVVDGWYTDAALGIVDETKEGCC